MPKIKSAKKALRQNIHRRKVNDEKKKTLKGTVKTFRKLVAEKKDKEARAALIKVFSTVDKTAKSNYIKKAKANRIKSRAAKLLKKLEA
jgi:ribosomal protein S20